MIYFVDFEASSLSAGSFPIEVAWVDQDGQGECYLIRPAEVWLNLPGGQPEWNPASERIHGISMATLLKEGEPHGRVAARAVQVLGRSHVMVCSDAPEFDEYWLDRLLQAAGIRREVELLNVRQIYDRACRPLLDLLPPGGGRERELAEGRVRNMVAEIVARAEEVEAMKPRVEHRALPDAESLWRTWRAIKDEVARRVAEEGQT